MNENVCAFTKCAFTKWLDERIARNTKVCEQLERPVPIWNADDEYLETLIIIRNGSIDDNFGDWLGTKAEKAYDAWVNNPICNHDWYAANARHSVFAGASEVWYSLGCDDVCSAGPEDG